MSGKASPETSPERNTSPGTETATKTVTAMSEEKQGPKKGFLSGKRPSSDSDEAKVKAKAKAKAKQDPDLDRWCNEVSIQWSVYPTNPTWSKYCVSLLISKNENRGDTHYFE